MDNNGSSPLVMLAITGCWAIVAPVHAEGVSAPTMRSGSIFWPQTAVPVGANPQLFTEAQQGPTGS